MNSKQFKKTKMSAFLAFIILDGISRTAVLGFKTSKCLSIYLLNAIAALRANTIHKMTNKNKSIRKVYCNLIAKKKPINAKGKAKMVWLNLISDKYVLIFPTIISYLK